MIVVAICTLIIALAGGWTAASVKVAVTETKVDVLAVQAEKARDIADDNRNDITRIDQTLMYLVKAINDTNQLLRELQRERQQQQQGAQQ
jgi:protein involved in polysaccharide export with SLBB domain